MNLTTLVSIKKNSGGMAVYLFRCLHCGKYHLVIDCD
ncbi:MAG: CbrC family protein [Clostridium sp.]|nr:CbrC family protein [Clostridium sp.]